MVHSARNHQHKTDPSPVNQQNRRSGQIHHLISMTFSFSFFFSIFFRGFSSLKNSPRSLVDEFFFSPNCKKNPGCFLWQFSNSSETRPIQNGPPFFWILPGKIVRCSAIFWGGDLDQLPRGIGPGTRWCSWSPLPRYFLITKKTSGQKNPFHFKMP